MDISFYPMNKKSGCKEDLSDTFSLQEMTIVDSNNSDDDEDSESQNLQFLSPPKRTSICDYIVELFCCINNAAQFN